VTGVPLVHPVLFTVNAEERAGLAVAQALASILVKMFYSRPAEWAQDALRALIASMHSGDRIRRRRYKPSTSKRSR